MSFTDLPPKDAPLKTRLVIAMSLAGYSQRALARDLGTDRSLIYKWRTGDVLRVTKPQHQQGLARLLNTPKDYWIDPPLKEQLRRLEEPPEN